MARSNGAVFPPRRWPESFSGTGGLLVDGSGTLTLSGANTYTGPTIVHRRHPRARFQRTLASLAISGGGKVVVNFSGSSLPVNSLTLNTNGILNLNYSFGG